jgi:alkane 1-monooxygenase
MTAAPLRLSDARFLLILLLPAATLANLLRAPGEAFWWAAGAWLTIAAVDSWWPGAQHSPAAVGPQPRLQWLLRLYVPLQLALLAAGLHAARSASGLEVAGLAFAVGFITGGMGITFAHELGHSRHRIDRALAWVLMTSVNYSHFMVEHYRGHHRTAATWADPASARRGESLWRFLPRTLVGSMAGAWRLEARQIRQVQQIRQGRGRRVGRGWLARPLVWSAIANLLLLPAVWLYGGALALAFWLGQSVMAIWLLEAVNYVEHYGLQRRAGGDGLRSEPFGLQHAWNADHVLSNSLLANLQRHSDHHLHPATPYPQLQALPGPQLPSGYSGCLLLAAVPPLWFAVMEPRLPQPAPI